MAEPWEGEGLECRQGNPSSSHAGGAGPPFSLWEKGLSRHRAECADPAAAQ
jgi:hypothetical protein